jgi:hypothetical protein
MQDGHTSTEVLLLRSDAHQKQDLHNKKLVVEVVF